MSIVGRTYLERGKLVKVLKQWRGTAEIVQGGGASRIHMGGQLRTPSRSGPRNVLIEREDGSLVVRPFRGLRKTPDTMGEER